MTQEILLPRKDKDGKFYISYSQHSSFKDKKGFNTGLSGELEYIQEKFFGKNFPDQGWGEFGEDTENYVCYREETKDSIKNLDESVKKHNEKYPDRPQKLISESLKSFDERERSILNKITPLGTFQKEIKIDILPNVYLLGYMDDCTKDMMHIRDYKTASKNSSKKYYTDEYEQLDIYSMYVLQETGKLPEKLEVCIIERKGNCFGMQNRRDLLSVGEEIWYHERVTSLQRLEQIRENILDSIYKISELYKVYLKTNV